MELLTRDFGRLTVAEDQVVHFTGPILGFEEYREFVFLCQQGQEGGFTWLQSTQEPGLCFLLVPPELVEQDYRPTLPAGTAELLGEGAYAYWLLASIRQPLERSTVNLKSPIVYNATQRTAAQVVLEGRLPIRRPLFQKGASTC